MVTNILAKTIEIRIVYRSGYYFYNRIENGLEVIQCQSVGQSRARQIYDNNQDAVRSISEGKPFNESGQPWAWSAWVQGEQWPHLF